MIIGVTGSLGAGKGSVVKYLIEQKGFRYLSVTGFMKQLAESRGIVPDRMVYHDIANEHRSQGHTKLQEAVMEHGHAKGITDNFVIEAQHTPEEVRFVQSKGGIVIGVDADIHVRYERITKRGHDKDNTTFEAFKAHEDLEMNPKDGSTNNLKGSIAAADFHIRNDGTLEELHNRIDVILSTLK